MAATSKERSEYFKNIAYMSKLIAHNRPVGVTDKLRKSYHRINDSDELNAACVNWAHFPCMVHIGHDIRFVAHGTGLPGKATGNHLQFLAPADGKDVSGGIEEAYDLAERAMNQFISYMRNDAEESGTCGNIFLLDENRMHAEQVGPINSKLYGWYLVFEDTNLAKDLLYNTADWYED